MPSRNAVSIPYPASVSTVAVGTPAATAALICISAICGLVWKATSSGTPARARRAGSQAQAWGRYRWWAMGRLA